MTQTDALRAAQPSIGRNGELEPDVVLRTPARIRDKRLRQALEDPLAQAVSLGRQNLQSSQHPDGHWCGELEGNTILESDYLLLLRFLDRFHEPRVKMAGEYIRRQQLPEGGWSIYPGGPPDVSTSVKAYFVLKLLHDPADAEHMVRARRAILEIGGVEACNSFTKLYLAIFGQYEWASCPAVPPELVLLPPGSPFNIYEMSSWSRVIVVPLGIIWSKRPSCPVPSELGIEELFVQPHAVHASHASNARTITSELLTILRNTEARWRLFFTMADRALKLWERVPLKPLRRRAIERSRSWMLDRLGFGEGFGAIFPSIINAVYALRCLGYEANDPLVRGQLEAIERLEVSDGETLRVQPCVGAVWDTVLALDAAITSNATSSEPWLQRAGKWVLDHEVRSAGDWSVKCPEGRPGGWYFQYNNELNPDCDDTAQAMKVLQRLELTQPQEIIASEAARSRAMHWLLAMQNDDGGWAAFDKNCDRHYLTLVPFADHNAMIDPSCPDITGRVLIALAGEGLDMTHPPIRRGVEYLRRTQNADGSWYGRWGCNYLYGTYLALTGLRAAGEDLSAKRYQKSLAWLHGKQNADGGWGESFASYEKGNEAAASPSTSTQSAWALLACFALGDLSSEAVRRGLVHLLERQREDGSWHDTLWTGTGFPKVFYLRYAYYDDYFPLLALATYQRRSSAGGES